MEVKIFFGSSIVDLYAKIIKTYNPIDAYVDELNYYYDLFINSKYKDFITELFVRNELIGYLKK